MGLSSDGLKYLVDGLRSNKGKRKIMYRIFVNNNNIDSVGIEYLMNYMKEKHNIRMLDIHSIYIYLYLYLFIWNSNGNNTVDILVQYTNYTSYIYNDFSVQINSAKYCQCITDPLEDSLLPQAVKSIEHHVKMTKFDADQPFKLRLRVSFVKDGDSETITTPTIIVQKNWNCVFFFFF